MLPASEQMSDRKIAKNYQFDSNKLYSKGQHLVQLKKIDEKEEGTSYQNPEDLRSITQTEEEDSDNDLGKEELLLKQLDQIGNTGK